MSINYTIVDLINNMIELEICGAEFYSTLAADNTNPLLSQLFGKLAEQEDKHRLLYEHLLKNKHLDNEDIGIEYRDYLREIINEKFDLNIQHVKTCSNPMEVLDLAMKLENDSIKFVTAFGIMTGTTYQDIVDQIKVQELNHLKMLVETKNKILT
ncbi:MAG: ferritin family protein [Victivallaceae bacterium]